MYSFQNDKYRKARGGASRILDVCCENCSEHVAYYQKDGPGQLKRMYVDRFIDIHPNGKVLACRHCRSELGSLYSYKKENRQAYRLFVGKIVKKTVDRRIIK